MTFVFIIIATIFYLLYIVSVVVGIAMIIIISTNVMLYHQCYCNDHHYWWRIKQNLLLSKHYSTYPKLYDIYVCITSVIKTVKYKYCHKISATTATTIISSVINLLGTKRILQSLFTAFSNCINFQFHTNFKLHTTIKYSLLLLNHFFINSFIALWNSSTDTFHTTRIQKRFSCQMTFKSNFMPKEKQVCNKK